MTGPILETARLRLRPFTREDTETLLAHWRNEDVRRWLWDGREVERDEVIGIVEESIVAFASGRAGFWVIERTGHGFAGFTGFRAMPNSTDLELYYGLDPAHWGAGVATEAARAAARWGFDTLGLATIPILTDGPNEASVAVMKRLGATYVRTDPVGAFGTTIVYVLRRAALSG
jgi:[ribosomal protein S5]-alanine N-acetyltransferase